MNVAKQLYQLQDVDLELESTEQAISQITGQLGEDQALVRVRNNLASKCERLGTASGQQRSLEWEIDDLASKLTAAEQELYSGRIRNPKELSSLQHEVEGMKAKRARLEDKALETMEEVELARKNVTALERELRVAEAEWHDRQQQLSTNLEQLRAVSLNLKHKRQRLAAEIDANTLEIYQELRNQKGAAVARVEQGICRGCRISLPVSELQRIRGGSLVRCSSCGRILFLP